MKALGAAALFCALALLSASAYAQLEPNHCADCRGKHETSEIGMSLIVQGKTVTGSYFDRALLNIQPALRRVGSFTRVGSSLV